MAGLFASLNMFLWRWGLATASLLGWVVDGAYIYALYLAHNTCETGTTGGGATVSIDTNGTYGCALVEELRTDIAILTGTQIGLAYTLGNSYYDWMAAQYSKVGPEKQASMDEAAAKGELFTSLSLFAL